MLKYDPVGMFGCSSEKTMVSALVLARRNCCAWKKWTVLTMLVVKKKVLFLEQKRGSMKG